MPTDLTKKKKNPAAVALGRLGGLKGGRARAASLSKEERVASASQAAKARFKRLSPEKRSEIAKRAAQARWASKGQ